MDAKIFDALTRSAANGATRRGALGLLAGAALAAGLAKFDLASAKKGKGKNKKKKCRKANQSCGGKKKKCCKGLSCTDGTCLAPSAPECVNDGDCGANEICQNGVCVPEQPECDSDNDCGSNEVCQNGECVAEPPECINDNDCDGNEVCDDGICTCGLEIGGECVVPCDSTSDCPGACNNCRGVFPGSGQPRVACVDEPGDLCDGAQTCDNDTECPSGTICAFTACDSPAGSGRCFPITCDA